MIYFKKYLTIVSITLFHHSLVQAIDIPKGLENLTPQGLDEVAVSIQNGAAQLILGNRVDAKTTKSHKLKAQEWWHVAALKGQQEAIRKLIESPKESSFGLTAGSQEKDEGYLRENLKKENRGELLEKVNNRDPEALYEIGKKWFEGFNYDGKHGVVNRILDRPKGIHYWNQAALAGHKKAITLLYKLNCQFLEANKKRS